MDAKKIPFHTYATQIILDAINAEDESSLFHNREPLAAPPAPVNAATGRPYVGANQFLLTQAAARMGVADSGLWCTARQAENLGCSVRPGAQGVSVILWSQQEPGPNAFRVPGASRVQTAVLFHSSQIDGLSPGNTPPRSQRDLIDYGARLLYNSGIPITEEARDAAGVGYDAKRDKIILESRSKYSVENREKYYCHMMPAMLDWGFRQVNKDGFGDSPERPPAGSLDEAREALAMALAEREMDAACGCGYRGERYLEYKDRWLELLGRDDNEFLRIANSAQKVAGYLQSVENDLVMSNREKFGRDLHRQFEATDLLNNTYIINGAGINTEYYGCTVKLIRNSGEVEIYGSNEGMGWGFEDAFDAALAIAQDNQRGIFDKQDKFLKNLFERGYAIDEAGTAYTLEPIGRDNSYFLNIYDAESFHNTPMRYEIDSLENIKNYVLDHAVLSPPEHAPSVGDMFYDSGLSASLSEAERSEAAKNPVTKAFRDSLARDSVTVDPEHRAIYQICPPGMHSEFNGFTVLRFERGAEIPEVFGNKEDAIGLSYWQALNVACDKVLERAAEASRDESDPLSELTADGAFDEPNNPESDFKWAMRLHGQARAGDSLFVVRPLGANDVELNVGFCVEERNRWGERKFHFGDKPFTREQAEQEAFIHASFERGVTYIEGKETTMHLHALEEIPLRVPEDAVEKVLLLKSAYDDHTDKMCIAKGLPIAPFFQWFDGVPERDEFIKNLKGNHEATDKAGMSFAIRQNEQSRLYHVTQTSPLGIEKDFKRHRFATEREAQAFVLTKAEFGLRQTRDIEGVKRIQFQLFKELVRDYQTVDATNTILRLNPAGDRKFPGHTVEMIRPNGERRIYGNREGWSQRQAYTAALKMAVYAIDMDKIEGKRLPKAESYNPQKDKFIRDVANWTPGTKFPQPDPEYRPEPARERFCANLYEKGGAADRRGNHFQILPIGPNPAILGYKVRMRDPDGLLHDYASTHPVGCPWNLETARYAATRMAELDEPHHTPAVMSVKEQFAVGLLTNQRPIDEKGTGYRSYSYDTNGDRHLVFSEGVDANVPMVAAYGATVRIETAHSSKLLDRLYDKEGKVQLMSSRDALVASLSQSCVMNNQNYPCYAPQLEFSKKMQAAGIITDFPVFDGKQHRATVIGGKPGNTDGSYTAEPDGRGVFNNYQSGVTGRVIPTNHMLVETAIDALREQRQARIDQLKAALHAQELARAGKTAQPERSKPTPAQERADKADAAKTPPDAKPGKDKSDFER